MYCEWICWSKRMMCLVHRDTCMSKSTWFLYFYATWLILGIFVYSFRVKLYIPSIFLSFFSTYIKDFVLWFIQMLVIFVICVFQGKSWVWICTNMKLLMIVERGFMHVISINLNLSSLTHTHTCLCSYIISYPFSPKHCIIILTESHENAAKKINLCACGCKHSIFFINPFVKTYVASLESMQVRVDWLKIADEPKL